MSPAGSGTGGTGGCAAPTASPRAAARKAMPKGSATAARARPRSGELTGTGPGQASLGGAQGLEGRRGGDQVAGVEGIEVAVHVAASPDGLDRHDVVIGVAVPVLVLRE